VAAVHLSTPLNKSPSAPPIATADAILVPAHNRRDLTLACLRALAAEGVLAWAAVVVIDDGSTDGTAEALESEFPVVYIIRGDGNWWWGGAIRRGMEWALSRGAARIFWLNDDCRPPLGGLRELRDFVAREDAVAWIEARTPRGWSYGAHRRSVWCVRRCRAEEERAGVIDTFSGNCVALPRGWIERAGLPDDAAFPHGLADLDYGLRLKRAGAPLRPFPGIVAASDEPGSAATERWLTSSRSMRAIWRDFSSPKSFLYFPAWRRFALRHWGPVWGWAVFVLPYARWAAILVLRTAAPSLARALARRSEREQAG
jgi:GT2 family glycosyltransferase